MANVYADLIEKHKKTLDDVPERIYTEVVAELIRRGYLDGDSD